MGSDLDLMAAMAVEMQKRGAPRIDLNCGCPSNTVTGRGAGSSLLKDPDFLYQVAKAIVGAVSIPVTAKLRSGFNDTGLFRENMLAAEASGISFLTLHPRTKVDGYGPPARWDLIREAKKILKIPVVGNGDILTVDDAKRMMAETGCDALMIGRGSVINPFIFHQIKANYAGQEYQMQWTQVEHYFATFLAQMSSEVPERTRVNKVKQLMSFMFKGNAELLAMRQNILTWTEGNVRAFLDFSLPQLKSGLLRAGTRLGRGL
jgi:tRNA-dihydrouridine synthase C